MTTALQAPLWTPWGKGFTRRSSTVALRAPSDERRRLASYTTLGDAACCNYQTDYQTRNYLAQAIFSMYPFQGIIIMGNIMAGDDLSQEEADRLFVLEKLVRDGTMLVWPGVGGKLVVDLVSRDRSEEFVVNATRSYIKISKLSVNARARGNIVLARLEIDGPPHRNPDDVEIEYPHLHIYREGFGDKWAFPLPLGVFTDIDNLALTFRQFMVYFNVSGLPSLDEGLL